MQLSDQNASVDCIISVHNFPQHTESQSGGSVTKSGLFVHLELILSMWVNSSKKHIA